MSYAQCRVLQTLQLRFQLIALIGNLIRSSLSLFRFFHLIQSPLPRHGNHNVYLIRGLHFQPHYALRA